MHFATQGGHWSGIQVQQTEIWKTHHCHIQPAWFGVAHQEGFIIILGPDSHTINTSLNDSNVDLSTQLARGDNWPHGAQSASWGTVSPKFRKLLGIGSPPHGVLLAPKILGSSSWGGIRLHGAVAP